MSEVAPVEIAELGALPPCRTILQNPEDCNLHPDADLHSQLLVHDCTDCLESLCFGCIMPDYTLNVGYMELLVLDYREQLLSVDLVAMDKIEVYPMHSLQIKRDAVANLEVVKDKM